MNTRILLLVTSFLLILSCKPDTPKELKISDDVEINDISLLIKKSPDDVSLLLERAKIFTKKQAFVSATEDLRKVIQLDSTNIEAYHLLSDCYMDNYKSRLALETMIDASKIFPDRIPTLLKLSETHFILQQYDRSIRVINVILSKDSQNAEAYFMLGLNFRDMGDKERAKNAFQTATEFDSSIIDAWIILGNIYESEGDSKALDYYNTATRINPKSTQAWHSLAYYLQNNGDIETALECYRKINLLDKSYRDAYLNAGILYLEKDSLDSAFEQFNLLIANNPTNHRGYIYRGLINKLMGNVNQGNQDMESALNLTNQSEEVLGEIINLEKLFEIGKKKK